LLQAAAIATAAAAVEGDCFVVVVVFVAAIQWRVGKTTAGMTNRALNTNWPCPPESRRAPDVDPHAHAPGGTVAHYRFFPRRTVRPPHRAKRLSAVAIATTLFTTRPAAIRPPRPPPQKTAAATAGALLHAPPGIVASETIIADDRGRQSPSIVRDDCLVRRKSRGHAHAQTRARVTTAVEAARGWIACTRSVPTAARTTPRSIVTPLNRCARRSRQESE